MKKWATIVAPNRDHASGAALEYITPVEEIGVKIVEIQEEETEDGMKYGRKLRLFMFWGLSHHLYYEEVCRKEMEQVR